MNGDQRQNGSTNHGAAYVFTLAEPLPELAITRGESGVRISWPQGAAGWQLEQSESSASPMDWSPVQVPYQSDAEGFFHLVEDPGGTGLFRLREP